MEVFEIGIIIIILCAQAYVAYLAWGQIESISHFLSSEDNLVLKQKSIEIEDDNKMRQNMCISQTLNIWEK